MNRQSADNRAWGAVAGIVRLLQAVAVTGMLFGCSGGGGRGGRGGADLLGKAVADYNAGRYGRAHERAVRIQREAEARLDRDQAAYLAGLSAYQMGDLQQARQRLNLAVRSANSATAARARASLGLVAMRAGRYREAAELLETAAGGLRGDDARQAAYHALVASELAGVRARDGQAQPHAFNGPPVYAGRGGGGPEPARFTIQVGAFRDRTRAVEAAADAGPIARRHGLGPVSVVPATDVRGNRLYLVQFGGFRTRSEAVNVRGRLGRLQFIIARLSNERSSS